MKVYNYKDISTIVYTGEEDTLCRDLKQRVAPTLKKGDILIVPTKNAKFMTRTGSPYELVDLENELNKKVIAKKTQKTTATKEAN